MQDQLKKALQIAAKTGEKIIILDSNSLLDPMVVIPLENYEKLFKKDDSILNLTEEEMLDKINRDIALWKNKNNIDSKNFPEKKEEFEEKEIYYYENVEDKKNLENKEADKINFTKEEKEKEEEKALSKNNWRISSRVKEAAEEVIEEL